MMQPQGKNSFVHGFSPERKVEVRQGIAFSPPICPRFIRGGVLKCRLRPGEPRFRSGKNSFVGDQKERPAQGRPESLNGQNHRLSCDGHPGLELPLLLALIDQCGVTKDADAA